MACASTQKPPIRPQPGLAVNLFTISHSCYRWIRWIPLSSSSLVKQQNNTTTIIHASSFVIKYVFGFTTIPDVTNINIFPCKSCEHYHQNTSQPFFLVFFPDTRLFWIEINCQTLCHKKRYMRIPLTTFLIRMETC